MATRASLTLRRDIGSLTRLADRDLAAIWRQVSDAATARVALNDVLPALVETYGQAAAAIAADWYDDLRDQSGVPGRFRAYPAVIADTGTAALAGWAAVEATSLDTMQTLVAGGLQRRIADWARQTVMGSSVADPRARGWQRVGSGDCDFCSMLIGRGAVYTEASADFQAHDHCGCSAEPEFR